MIYRIKVGNLREIQDDLWKYSNFNNFLKISIWRILYKIVTIDLT